MFYLINTLQIKHTVLIKYPQDVSPDNKVYIHSFCIKYKK